MTLANMAPRSFRPVKEWRLARGIRQPNGQFLTASGMSDGFRCARTIKP